MGKITVSMRPDRQSVTDTVTMFAVRERGKNVPYTNFTFYVDEAEKWLTYDESHHLTSEIVTVEIKPYKAGE